MNATDDFLRQLPAMERWQTAHHEAGHAVAAVQRGGTFHGVSLADHGWTHVDALEDRHRDFVIFAGPWAECRAQWGERPLDGRDGNGSTLHDYLRGAMRSSHDDLRKYVTDRDLSEELWDATLFSGEQPDIPLAREDSWYAELESCWPTMKRVAEKLLGGHEVTAESVRNSLGISTH